MKRTTRTFVLLFILALGLSLSAVSANQRAVSYRLPAAAETQAVGGSCGGALGVAAGLGLGALSPCSVVCATLAWYSLAYVAYEC